MRFFQISFLWILSILPINLLGQESNWHDRYISNTIENLISSFTGATENECLKPCFNFYGLYDNGFKVEMKYLDSIKNSNEIDNRYIEEWATVYITSAKGKFFHQILFSSNGKKYWIHVQESTLEYYKKELNKNDKVYLYMMLVGTIIQNKNIKHVFIANDFEKEEVKSIKSEKQQSLKTYAGNFENGSATYSYFENDNYERIYQGKFDFNESVIKYDGLRLNISGSFLNDQRNGKWIFSVKNTKSPVLELLTEMDKLQGQMALQLLMNYGASEDKILEVQNRLKNNKIVYQTYNSVLTGNYIAGKLDGIWTFNETFTGSKEPIMGFTNHKINKPISSKVNFKNNMLIGDFIFKQDENNFVIGQFDENGKLTGKWIIKWITQNGEFENIREYENGNLIKMIERNVSTGEILFRGNNKDGEGRGIKNAVISFWQQTIGKDEIGYVSISDRNYMFRLNRGVIKPSNGTDLQNSNKDDSVVKKKIEEKVIEKQVEEKQEEVIEKEEPAFLVVEENASFQGGDINTFNSWIKQNVIYPTLAAENNRQGKVMVQFAINSRGDVVDVKVIRSVDPSLDVEAVRVIKSSPKWTPGKQGGKSVKQQFTLPVVFQLTTN